MPWTKRWCRPECWQDRIFLRAAITGRLASYALPVDPAQPFCPFAKLRPGQGFRFLDSVSCVSYFPRSSREKAKSHHFILIQ